MMGLPMDFTVAVTKWVEGREKQWETVGAARMIILSWYRMDLRLVDEIHGTMATLSIAYTLPRPLLRRLVARVLAPWYAGWCLRHMLNDSRKALEGPVAAMSVQ